MRILGIHGWGHDTAAALFDDYRLIAAVQEERLTRIKSWGVTVCRGCGPPSACERCLTAVSTSSSPMRLYTRLLEASQLLKQDMQHSLAASMSTAALSALIWRRVPGRCADYERYYVRDLR
jgi:predicted NodU family carbamoyl transferase